MKEMMSVRETNPDYRNLRRSLTNEQARDVMLAQAPNHKKIEKDAVVMYKDGPRADGRPRLLHRPGAAPQGGHEV